VEDVAYLTNDIKNEVFDDERILHISDMYETSSEYCKNLSFYITRWFFWRK